MTKLILSALFIFLWGCAEPQAPTPTEEPEMLSRTAFTERIENFFEYAPFRANQPSQFLIHLTDLSDGTPLEQAEVILIAHPAGGTEVAAQTTAQVGRVTGIYVAELTPPRAGDYDLEFHIRNSRVDERMLLSDFKVE